MNDEVEALLEEVVLVWKDALDMVGTEEVEIDGVPSDELNEARNSPCELPDAVLAKLELPVAEAEETDIDEVAPFSDAVADVEGAERIGLDEVPSTKPEYIDKTPDEEGLDAVTVELELSMTAIEDADAVDIELRRLDTGIDPTELELDRLNTEEVDALWADEAGSVEGNSLVDASVEASEIDEDDGNVLVLGLPLSIVEVADEVAKLEILAVELESNGTEFDKKGAEKAEDSPTADASDPEASEAEDANDKTSMLVLPI